MLRRFFSVSITKSRCVLLSKLSYKRNWASPITSVLKRRSFHSRVTEGVYSDDFKVIVVPLLEDNYSYILVDKESNCAVVDCGDAKASAILNIIEKHELNLTSILCTHHHADHIAGNDALIASTNNHVDVIASDERIGGVTRFVDDGDVINFGNVAIRTVITPCHTKRHVSFVVSDMDSDTMCAFVGDTLFASGCGRFFEGTATDMFDSLSKLAALPPTTMLYFGHEYTHANLRFALSIEPDNGHLQDRLEWCNARRESALPTSPTTVADELLCNPFLRAKERALAKRLGFVEWSDTKDSYIATMSELRARKDAF